MKNTNPRILERLTRLCARLDYWLTVALTRVVDPKRYAALTAARPGIHQCCFSEAPWPAERGPSVTDFDDDETVQTAYGLSASGTALFKYLLVCPCGKEKVYTRRALY